MKRTAELAWEIERLLRLLSVPWPPDLLAGTIFAVPLPPPRDALSVAPSSPLMDSTQVLRNGYFGVEPVQEGGIIN